MCLLGDVGWIEKQLLKHLLEVHFPAAGWLGKNKTIVSLFQKRCYKNLTLQVEWKQKLGFLTRFNYFLLDFFPPLQGAFKATLQLSARLYLRRQQANSGSGRGT